MTKSGEQPTMDLHADGEEPMRVTSDMVTSDETSAEANDARGNDEAPAEANDVHGDGETLVQETLDVVSSEAPLADPVDELDDDEIGAQLALRNLERRRAEKRRKKRLRLIVASVLAFGLLATILGMRYLSSQGAGEEAAPQTALVERTDFEDSITSSGALKAGSTVMVTPEVDGIIESVMVSEGQHVNTGDVLLTIKNESLDRAVRDAAQEVQTAQQGVSSAQQDVSLANAARDEAWDRYYEQFAEADAQHRDWEDAKNNYAVRHNEWEQLKYYADSLACGEPIDPGDAPSDDTSSAIYQQWKRLKDQYYRDLEAYQAYQDALAEVPAEPQPAGVEPTYPEPPVDSSLISSIQSAENAVTTANSALTKANEAYDEAVKNAEKRTIKAPASGNVVAVGAKVGESVGGATGGTTTPSTSRGSLVQISDVNSMSVDIEVNEIDVLKVKKGQNAKVTFSAVPDAECNAQVAEVATIATGSGGEGGGTGGGIVTFHVRLVIANPDPKLREGMTATVKIITASADNVLVVPAGAVTEGENGATVEVVTSEDPLQSETRPVKVSMRNSSQAVIQEGLQGGEKVIVGYGTGDSGEM